MTSTLSAKSDRIRPPRIDLRPHADVAVKPAPIAEDVLAKWLSVRSANSDSDNVIRIFDVIGADWGEGITADSIARQLKSMNGQDVEIHINTPGGDMFEGIAIYNVLRDYKGKITVKVMALAASAGSVIAMAGDEILTSPSSFIMIHNCWIAAIGNRNDLLDFADHLLPFDQALRDIYVARTGQDPVKVQTWMDDESFMNGSVAIERGFATGLLAADAVTEDPAASASLRSRARAGVQALTQPNAKIESVRDAELLLRRGGAPTRLAARLAKPLWDALSTPGNSPQSELSTAIAEARAKLASLKGELK